jgi:protein CpxP
LLCICSKDRSNFQQNVKKKEKKENSMKKMVLVAVAVLFVIGVAFSADAVIKKNDMGKHGDMAACDGDCCLDGSPMNMLKTLGLDEKQKEAVQSIHFRTKKDMIRMRADEQVAEIELREILSKDPVDLKTAEAAVKKIEGMKSEMKITHIKAKEEIKSNLTPEQRKKFVSLMGQMDHRTDMKSKCNMRDMGHGPHGGETPPMQHKHN